LNKGTLPLVILLFSAPIAGYFVGNKLFPGKDVPVNVVPTIVTRYDTVSVTPKWYEDSVKYWKKRKWTTDTVNVTLSETVIDTQYVPIDGGPAVRPDWYPLLNLNSGNGTFGDTMFIHTFSLKDGKDAVSRVFIPGYLVGIDAQYPNKTPRLDFRPFPPQERHNWFYPVKYTGMGILGGLGLGLLGCIAK
jgi:hypothetical protein